MTESAKSLTEYRNSSRSRTETILTRCTISG
nr:MAG TPA_asm: hypothetical protein [Caudoviricetes sp.]